MAGTGWTVTKAIQMARWPLDENRFWETGGEQWTAMMDPFGKAEWYDLNDPYISAAKTTAEIVSPLGAGKLKLLSTSKIGPIATSSEIATARLNTTLKPLGLGSTGRTAANSLKEQLAMEEIMANPVMGRVIKEGLGDPKWKGWSKMAWNSGGVEIHYVGKFEEGGT